MRSATLPRPDRRPGSILSRFLVAAETVTGDKDGASALSPLGFQSPSRHITADGRVSLLGRVPNGQQFQLNPRLLWTVRTTRVRLSGHDLGPTGPLLEQDRLADFRLPQRGLFVVGEVYFEILDPARHASARPAGGVAATKRHAS